MLIGSFQGVDAVRQSPGFPQAILLDSLEYFRVDTDLDDVNAPRLFFSLEYAQQFTKIRAGMVKKQSLHGSDDFQVVESRLRREISVRFDLVPERSRSDVILAGKVTSSASLRGAIAQILNGYAKTLLKADRIHNMPTVQSKALLGMVHAIRLNDLR